MKTQRMSYSLRNQTAFLLSIKIQRILYRLSFVSDSWLQQGSVHIRKGIKTILRRNCACLIRSCAGCQIAVAH